jgi:hypothetical protein
MAAYTLPHFGDLDLKNLEEYYDVDIDYNGNEIQLDLNFDANSIDPKRMDVVKQFIDNIAEFDKKNRTYIEADFADEDADTVREYIEHHLDELPNLVKQGDESSPEMQLLNALRLVRVGLYPDGEDQFAIFDYSIGKELTQYLVVINTDEKGNLDYLTMES